MRDSVESFDLNLFSLDSGTRLVSGTCYRELSAYLWERDLEDAAPISK